EAYEEVTGCKFEPVQRDDIRSGDKGKYASVYLTGVDSYKQKVHTDAVGNFKFDDLPIGHYEIVAEKESKKESCDEGWSVVSDYPVHRSYKIIQLLVVPNKTSLVEIDEIDPQEVFVIYLDYDLEPETLIEWKIRLKK
ncbi:MAG: carboxypeptidase-like regulatory domain-containing protein, partial [Ekhidna sp.]|nr:carboxypeptidase-like regulatory domain-containing protein [Ekhidna sp.]